MQICVVFFSTFQVPYPSFLLSSGILHMSLALLACASEHGQAKKERPMVLHCHYKKYGRPMVLHCPDMAAQDDDSY